MHRPKFPRPALGTVLGGLALVVSLGGVAYATIPGSNGQIEGCYDPSGAKPPYTLKVVDNPADCASPSVLLPFNQTGPTGPTGATGPQGQPGPTGPAGVGTPAPGTVGSAQLQAGAVTHGKIAPGALGQTNVTLESGRTSTRLLSLPPGARALIDGVQQALRARGDTAYNFTLSAHNPGKHAITLTAQVLVNHKLEEGSFSQTIAPGSSATLAGVLKCNGMPAGHYTAALRVISSGGRAVVSTSTLIAQSEMLIATP